VVTAAARRTRATAPAASAPKIEWPADQVERRPLAELFPYARNARTHSDAQVAQIAGSIREWGWTIPVLIDEQGELIAGHGRVLAARQLGIEAVPVMTARGWSEAKIRAYRIADNKLGLNSGWDDELLALELADLKELGAALDLTGFDAAELSSLLSNGAGGGEDALPTVSLADRFMLPPFSVLNAREGWWQARKAAWIALGLTSELGRGGNPLKFSEQANAVQAGHSPYKQGKAVPGGGGGAGAWQEKGAKGYQKPTEKFGTRGMAFDGGPMPNGSRQREIDRQAAGLTMQAASSHPRYYEQKTAVETALGRVLTAAEFEADHWDPPPDSPMTTGTSIFDPVLCEIAYRWFCPPDGLVLDPFAGGSVRGIVAGRLGRRYQGVDLSADQIAANEAQRSILRDDDPPPQWTCGDSIGLAKLCKGTRADFVFSCPPYADLERYSDDPRDISTMEYPAFLEAYRAIINAACALLRPDRFACFVVGEVRGDDGTYLGFVPDTIRAFTDDAPERPRVRQGRRAQGDRGDRRRRIRRPDRGGANRLRRADRI
jgi:hypothetical protein